MPWIESHTGLARHPKTLRLARILDLPVPAALGHLHLLWWWAIEYAPDGDVGRFDASDLALACMWEGDEAALLPALQRAGFVDKDGHIHDWHDYAGKLVDRRRANAERMREARQGERATHVQNTPSINSEAPPTRAAHVQVTCDERAGRQDQQNQPTEPTNKTDRVAPDAYAPDAPVPLEPVAPDEPTEPAVRAVPKPPKAKSMGHPAVQVYRRLTDISPKEVIRVAIEAAVPAADEEAVERFRQAVAAWTQSGYSARNVTGMLEWYRDGIPPGKRPKTAPRRTEPAPLPGPISYPTAEEREEHRRLGGASGANGTVGRPLPPAEEALKAAAERLVAAGKVTPQQIEAARRASKQIGQPGATP